jgi:thiamine biosynthesis lipoprotein
MDRLVGLFSRFDSSSPVSLLNQDGYLKDPPSELLQLLNVSIHYNLISNGAFDITVLPILTLIEKSFSTTGQAPAEYELNKMRSVVGSRHLMISEGCVSFARSGMAITLDSIAKGFIVDKVMATLHAEGVRHALVNGGGDIAVLGGKGEGRPWRIAIQDPHKQGHSVDVLSLYTGAVATSGSYEIFFDQEKLYHHLISPGEFLPANENTSVSVRAPSVMTADALATAVFVMGPAQGARFLDSQQIIEGLIISNNNKTFSSSQWQG